MFTEIPSCSPSSVEYGGGFCFVSLFIHMQDLVVLRKGVLNKKKKKERKRTLVVDICQYNKRCIHEKFEAVFHRCNFKCKNNIFKNSILFFPFCLSSAS